MSGTRHYRVGAVALTGALAALAWRSTAASATLDPASTLATYWLLMVAPGLALYLLVEREPRWEEAAGAALVASPVLLVVPAVLAMLSGTDARLAARGVAVASAALSIAAAVRSSRLRAGVSGRGLAVLTAFLLILCALTAFLPMTDEWWRIRSDAWAHRAYIAEAADFGVPPQDPYFLGFPLQYMWAYHVLILVVSDACNFDPFWMMAVLNVHALAGLVLATFLFAGTLVKDFARRMMSVVTVTLGMNAAFWVFAPFKALKALTGETRGLDEIARQFSLSPLSYRQATEFTTIFHNKTFFLDKFMVGTAFGIGLCLMAATWYAASRYLERRRTFPLVLIFVTTVGMLAFHTLVGSVMLVGTLGALAALGVARRGVDGFSLAAAARLAAAMALGLAVASPYVYSVLHSKDTIGQTTLALFAMKIAGVAISMTLVAFLAVWQRWILRERGVVARFVLFAAAVVALYAMTVPLPGPNSFDKPVFFLFFPVAVVGAWSIVDLARWRGWMLAGWVAALAFVPLNAVMFAGCFQTQPDWTLTSDEHAAADWLRANTPRDAALLDDDDRVVFVTTVPRRHYWGRLSFAYQWGYDRLEMSRRYHAWRTLYSNRPLDAETLASLGSVESELFVVVRSDRHDEGANVNRHPEYFRAVYQGGGISVFEVDAARCRSDAGRFPTVSEEELLRESGLR